MTRLIQVATDQVGTYDLSESAVPGYTNTSITCDDNPGVAVTHVSLALGESKTCTFVNDDNAPSLTIIKQLTGPSATFSLDVTGANTFSTTLTPGSNATAQYGPQPIMAGTSSISEGALPTDYLLTDSVCTDGTGAELGVPSNLNPDSGAPATWTIEVALGQNITCTFTNSGVQTTRTQGFWATHVQLTNGVWNGSSLPLSGSIQVAGSADAELCGYAITADTTAEENLVMGGFWASISNMSSGSTRTSIDQTRMQLLQQYLAAVLNVHTFGSGGETMLAEARTAFCGSDEAAISDQVGILTTYNESGDNLSFDPGHPNRADPKEARAEADIDGWDIPQYPGTADDTP